MAQTLDQIMASLNPVYNPQRDLINQQISALPGQEQAAVQGLDTAKSNAFNDITNTANTRGLLYSGMPIQEEQRYVGEKYLPAVANLKSSIQGQRTKLQSALLGLNAEQTTKAQGIQQQQVANDIAQQRAAQQAAMQQAQLAARQQTAAARPAKDPYSITRDKAGGYQFAGPGGVPITAAQYYAAHGGSWQDLASFIQNSSSNAQLKTDMGRLTPQQLTQKYPYIFGGV